jgi:hypothetical protein
MNNLVAQMMGRKAVREDVPVPVGVPRARSGRDRNALYRRTSAALLGLGEADDDDESIIPADAEDVQNITGPSGIRMDDKAAKKDKEAPEADHPSEVPGSGEDSLLTPRDALVAPDVTPQAMEPIDASEVPHAKGSQPPEGQVPRFTRAPQSDVNPMDVLLGRTSTRPARPEPEPENVVTAESAQATVNTLLSVGGVSGEALLRNTGPMPEPKQGDASKIMEAFSKYGPKPNRSF